MVFNGKQESKISFRKWLNALEEKETQQKKFIKWLEDEIERLPSLTTFFYRNEKGNLIGHTKIVQGAYKEVLRKYEEIMNGDDNNDKSDF